MHKGNRCESCCHFCMSFYDSMMCPAHSWVSYLINQNKSFLWILFFIKSRRRSNFFSYQKRHCLSILTDKSRLSTTNTDEKLLQVLILNDIGKNAFVKNKTANANLFPFCFDFVQRQKEIIIRVRNKISFKG